MRQKKSTRPVHTFELRTKKIGEGDINVQLDVTLNDQVWRVLMKIILIVALLALLGLNFPGIESLVKLLVALTSGT